MSRLAAARFALAVVSFSIFLAILPAIAFTFEQQSSTQSILGLKLSALEEVETLYEESVFDESSSLVSDEGDQFVPVAPTPRIVEGSLAVASGPTVRRVPTMLVKFILKNEEQTSTEPTEGSIAVVASDSDEAITDIYEVPALKPGETIVIQRSIKTSLAAATEVSVEVGEATATLPVTRDLAVVESEPTVTGVRANGLATASQVKVSYTIKNLGTAPTADFTSLVTIELMNGKVLKKSVAVKGLAAGSSKLVTHSFSTGRALIKAVNVIVDPNKTIFEDDTNNRIALSFGQTSETVASTGPCTIGDVPRSSDNSNNIDELVQDVKELNKRLVSQFDLFNSLAVGTQDTIKPGVIAVAKERKISLIKLMRLNPPEAASNLLNVDQQSLINQSFPGCVEAPINLTGYLTMLFDENFEKRTSHFEYNLVLDKEPIERWRLFPTNNLQVNMATGLKTIKADGHVLDQNILGNVVVQSPLNRLSLAAYDYGATERISNKETQPSLGEQKTLLIMVDFADSGNGSVAFDDPKKNSEIVFKEMNDYYLENSYQQTWIKGKAVGVYTIPDKFDVSYCFVLDKLLSAAIKAAANDVDFRKYNRLIVIASDRCGGGNGTVGYALLGTPNGNVVMSYATLHNLVQFNKNKRGIGLSAVAHEFGHNLGLHHANKLDCGTETIKKNLQDCKNLEYEDTADVMGATLPPTPHMNAPHKNSLGWFNKNLYSPKTITVPGSYSIAPLEFNAKLLKKADQAQALKIPRGVNQEPIWIEYRQPVGYDSPFATGAPDAIVGALLHLDSPDTNTYLLDATPDDSLDLLSLHLGEYFTDPFTSSTIRVVKVAKDELVISFRTSPPKDSDGDKIWDEDDACPQVAGPKTNDPKTNGCPVPPPPPPMSKLSAFWEDDTPTGAARPDGAQIIGKFILEHDDQNKEPALVRLINFDLLTTFPALTSPRRLTVYKDPVTSTPTAIAQYIYPAGAPLNGPSAIAEADFADINIPRGDSVKFYVTLDTTEARAAKDTLNIRIRIGDIIWFNGSNLTITDVKGLPLPQKTLVY